MLFLRIGLGQVNAFVRNSLVSSVSRKSSGKTPAIDSMEAVWVDIKPK